ncbi:MAG: M55 family metallopeptidase [Chloroflexota bacterium]
MKLYMLWDMEGVSGLFTREQAWYWEEGVSEQTAEEGRRLLMADINAAVAAALEAGADEVIVCDTHHGGGNIRVPEMLADPRVTYYGRSRLTYPNGRQRWMPGLDQAVDGFLLPGHHAKAGTPGAFLPHTSSLAWADFRINDQSVGEIGLEACYAGHWEVPLVFVQGDEAACREAEAQFPGVLTAAVKRAESAERCSGPDPEAARRLTAQQVAETVARLRAGVRPAPYTPRLPMTVSIRMATAQDAERAAQRPGVRRVDDCTVEGRAERQCDVIRWITGTGVE